MTEDPRNRIDIHGGNYGAFNVGGTTHGPMSGATFNQQGASADEVAALIALIDRLRGEIADAPVRKREVLEDSLDDLADDARRLQNPEEAAKVEPAAARRAWAKVKGLLTGVAQVTETVAGISGHVDQLFGG
ncbi:hypothetical protein [Amycolatopsis nigrescens]|uniref:hypothetical protein n=1 Tax=Amycolatopsis nigrescens TaxID=381445 RepID=UPI00036E0F11|nr:hypothetical protein [Amycolatopsis nigrescens]